MPHHPSNLGVGIVLLNYGGSSDTLACLDSLLDGTAGFTRLVIADNASPNDDLGALLKGLSARLERLGASRARWGIACDGDPLVRRCTRDEVNHRVARGLGPSAWVTVIDNGANLGFAGGNNVGLRLLAQDKELTHFWLLNNDTEVLPDTLARALDASRRRPEVDLWGHTLVYHDRPQEVQALGGGAIKGRAGETRHLGAFTQAQAVRDDKDFVNKIETEMDYVIGASMWASRRWLASVGFLCEDYFLYYEELDWAQRGRSKGLQLGYAPEVVVRHKEGASIGTTPSGGSPFSMRHLARSRVLFCRNFLPPGARWWLLGSVMKITAKLALRGRWPQARAVWSGTAAGWRASQGTDRSK